jgi:hypothetical protein
MTINGATLFPAGDAMAPHAPVWNPVSSSLHGRTDRSKKDLVIKHVVPVFGLYTSLSALFPSYILNPVPGASIFGAAGNAAVWQGRNNDRITYPNSQITRLLNLHLGVDGSIFSAAIEITSIITSGANPEDAGAYFVRDTNAYVAPAISMANYLKTRWTAAWTGKTGFGTVVGQKGFDIAWTFDAKPVYVEGWGTVDFTTGEEALTAAVKCIPIGPTAAQTDTAQAVNTAHGTLLSASAADLTLTGGAASIVAKKAGMVSFSTAFGVEPLRVNEVAWETTRGFTANVPDAVATVA